MRILLIVLVAGIVFSPDFDLSYGYVIGFIAGAWAMLISLRMTSNTKTP